MKRVTAILCATALVSFMPATPALAANNGAVITKDGACNGFVPTAGGGVGTFLPVGDITLNVVTKSGNGTIVCKFDVPEGLVPSTVRRASDFPCGILGGGFATSSRMVVTPSGQATLTCHFKASS
jgi:hypothetical protein